MTKKRRAREIARRCTAARWREIPKAWHALVEMTRHPVGSPDWRRHLAESDRRAETIDRLTARREAALDRAGVKR